MTPLLKAKAQLFEDNLLTCVIIKDKEIYKSTLRGVKPLLEFLDSRADLRDGSAADKVVGKGAAFLYVLLGVKEVFAGVISESALDVLSKNGIKTEYDNLVPAIKNRKGDGFCPIETAVLNESDPAAALSKIRETLKNLK